MVAAVAAISIASCKKDDTDDLGDNCMITQVANEGDISKLTYDNLGRLVKISEIAGDDGSTITYASNKITVKDDDTDDITELTLQNGRVVKSMEVGDSDYEAYTYNSEGYLITIEQHDPAQSPQLESTTEITYSGGNISKVTETDSDGSVEVTNYEYSADTAPSVLFTASPLFDLVENYFPGINYGKDSKNLRVKSTETSTSNDPNNPSTSKGISTFTYAKDAKGNYTTMTINYTNTYTSGGITTSNSDVEKYDVTYSCN